MGDGILFISPDSRNAGLLTRMLLPLSLALEHAGEVSEARRKLAEKSYGVILTEARLPDGNWIDVLNLVNDLALTSILIVTDPLADELLWAEVLNLGAYDLLVQPFDAGEVQRILFSASLRSLQKSASSQPAASGESRMQAAV